LSGVKAPSDKDVAVRVTEVDAVGFNLDFTPLEVGPHRLKVMYGSQCPAVEPLIVMAYDSSTIRVMGIKDGLVGCHSSRFIGMCTNSLNCVSVCCLYDIRTFSSLF